MNKQQKWWTAGVIAIVIIVILIVAWQAGTAKAPTAPANTATTTMATGTAQMGSSSSPTSSALTGNGSSTITTTFTPGYATSDYSLTYPSGWTPSVDGNTFSLTTFNGKYLNGGIIPQGGAEIDVATTTVYNNLSSIIQTELLSATNVSTSTIALDGTPCVRASYNDTYNDTVGSQDVAIYCTRSTELWKIYLSYRTGDPAAAAHVAGFTSVLTSMKLL